MPLLAMSPILETASLRSEMGRLEISLAQDRSVTPLEQERMSRYVTQYKMAFKSITAFENSYEMTKNFNSMPFFRFDETFPNVRGHLIRVS